MRPVLAPIQNGKLGHNTYGHVHPYGWWVRLYDTVVVAYDAPTDSYAINTGGFPSKTTIARLNAYTPFTFFRKDKVLGVCRRGDWDNSQIVHDGMRLTADCTPVGGS